MTILEAKNILAQKRRGSSVLGLTPEICSLIIAAGGPTFKPSGNGFVCNQTGEKVGKRTLAYTNRVSGLAAGPKPKEAEPAKPERQNTPQVPDLPKAIVFKGRVYCPRENCLPKRMIDNMGYYSENRGTTMTCNLCEKEFFVE